MSFSSMPFANRFPDRQLRAAVNFLHKKHREKFADSKKWRIFASVIEERTFLVSSVG